MTETTQGQFQIKDLDKILEKPVDERQFELALNQLQEFQEGKMRKWKPLSDIVDGQNKRVVEFLKMHGENLDLGRDVNYDITAKLRGRLETITSRQKWGESGGERQLAYIWQYEYVDHLQISIMSGQKRETIVDGKKHQYEILEMPLGFFKPYSNPILKATDIPRPCDLEFRSPEGYPTKAVQYFSDLVDRFLKKPDVKVEIKK